MMPIIASPRSLAANTASAARISSSTVELGVARTACRASASNDIEDLPIDRLSDTLRSMSSLPLVALVRPIPSSYADCLRLDREKAIDVERARHQHKGYVEALAAAGVEVITLPLLDQAPDSVFIED